MTYRDDLKEWARAAGIRAIRTFAQVALATIGTDMVGFSEVDWVRVASYAGVSAILSILTSVVTGLPEVDGGVQLVGKHRAEE